MREMGEIFSPQNICEAAKLSKTTGRGTVMTHCICLEQSYPFNFRLWNHAGADPVIIPTRLSSRDSSETHLVSSSGL